MASFYGLTIFLSAFLLFQVQPLIGKYVLPWFGSSPSVWTTAVLFFQFVVLAGYAYAHAIARMSVDRRWLVVHLALLAGALLLLPITPAESWRPAVGDDPGWRLLGLLAANLGLACLLLSASSPLLQSWLARLRPEVSPYPLYAVSNAGSLLALLSYPFVVERTLGLQTQMWAWSGGFAAFAGLSAWGAWRAATPGVAAPTAPAAGRPGAAASPVGPDRGRILWWLALATTASVMLLATMNRLSQDVPAVPFLFVLPLGLYLVTFILAFGSERWYARSAFCWLMTLSMLAAATAIHLDRDILEIGLLRRIELYCLPLFACCMCCHGELARLKPAPRQLTRFYLVIALGGALGGVLVAVIAPTWFEGYWEYPLALAASYGLVMLRVVGDLGQGPRRGWTASAAALGFALLVGFLGWSLVSGREYVIRQERDFYGVLRLTEIYRDYPRLHRIELYHGFTRHGMQYLLPARRGLPTTYYTRNSGVGIALTEHPARALGGRPLRIGVVGLGAGTLAAYANVGTRRDSAAGDDVLRFYEIDPRVVAFAESEFTFLEDARARGADVEIWIGDARNVMERQLASGEAQRFDVLVIDAFTGDAIPMHLLTQECFDVYWAHLAPDGILAVHVSNHYLDLRPLVARAAAMQGMRTYLVDHMATDLGADESEWVLATGNPVFARSRRLAQAAQQDGMRVDRDVLWTDDFGSLFDVLR